MWRVYIAGQIYPMTPLYGSSWGHKIANLILLPCIFFIIGFTALEWISYKESLGTRSDLPRPPLMGQTGVIKEQILCFCLISPLKLHFLQIIAFVKLTFHNL